MASATYSGSPCAACKFLRRKCVPDCIFAAYFPPEEPQKFANVHKVFGASNVSKVLNEILPHQREDAVSSLAYEAEARIKDPVYGCVGAISVLQLQVLQLQKELDSMNANILQFSTPRLKLPAIPEMHDTSLPDADCVNQISPAGPWRYAQFCGGLNLMQPVFASAQWNDSGSRDNGHVGGQVMNGF